MKADLSCQTRLLPWLEDNGILNMGWKHLSWMCLEAMHPQIPLSLWKWKARIPPFEEHSEAYCKTPYALSGSAHPGHADNN